MAEPEFRILPTDQVHESPLNPRTYFDAGEQAELTASVKAKGILEPLIVRPNAKGFEIAAGARRHRAAVAAALSAVPAIVRELSDADLVEIAVIENLQRAGVHELEEAEGFERLMKLKKLGADDLAAMVKKSKEHVWGRLKLLALIEPARKAFLAKKFNASVALLIARMPASVQSSALKEITARGGEEPMSYRAARDWLARSFMPPLKSAPFKPQDATLVPEAGACGPCPKRAANQPEIFPDIKDGDVCTDVTCFAAKRKAHYAVIESEALARGQKVISGKAAKEIAPHGLQYGLQQGYVVGDHRNYSDTKQRTYDELAKKAGVQATLLKTDDGVVNVYPQKVMAAALQKAGVVGPSASEKKARADERARKEKAKHELAVAERILEAIRGRIAAGSQITEADGSMIAIAMWNHTGFDARVRMMKLYGWGPPGDKKATTNDYWAESPKCAEYIAKMKPAELWSLMVDLTLAEDLVDPSGRPSKMLLAAAERHAVDAAQIRKDLAANAKPRSATKASATPTAKGKKPPKPAGKQLQIEDATAAQ